MNSQIRLNKLKKIELVQKDPFRLFFPLGGLFALFGVLVWVLHAFAPNYFDYNAMVHKTIMIGGFISSIVAGFLLTAITRFTETEFVSKTELLFQIIVLLVSVTSTLAGNGNFFFIGSAIFYLGIAHFAFNRIIKRRQNPPSTFIFVFLGIIMFIISSLFLGLEIFPFYTHI